MDSGTIVPSMLSNISFLMITNLLFLIFTHQLKKVYYGGI